ncbi:MAG: serine protease spb1 [Bdellovibrio sp. CG10_big_fil_rev_8_21_14_0_10_47_8]|nr:MAG: serine protease spb1 [Bdellovibrio sp. CG10_big_fil_rev_8_21_14_0_10_47_8]
MSGKWKACVLVGFSCLIFMACARPNYKDTSGPLVRPEQALKDCRLFFHSQQLCAEMSWTQVSTAGDESQFTVRFYHKEDPLVSVDPQGAFSVELWMPSMGHGAPEVSIQKRLNSPGFFDVREVYFIMRGPWDLRLRLQIEGGARDEVIESVTI